MPTLAEMSGEISAGEALMADGMNWTFRIVKDVFFLERVRPSENLIDFSNVRNFID